jgi:RES domain
VSPLALPPDDLSGFPRHVVERGQRLYRVHRRELGPWWFSGDGSDRFDLSAPGRGTCYLAARPVGAFIEVFRVSTVIPEVEVVAKFLAELRAPRRAVVADWTVAEGRGFGVTGAIHSQPNNDRTRAWADAFAAAGFAGVRYRVSHDPSQKELGVALFGQEGAQDLPVAGTGAIPPEVLDEALTRFALRVAPTPD